MATSSSRRISLKEPTLIALETLRSHKLRSFLTLLGVILSVSTLIVVVSLIDGRPLEIVGKAKEIGSTLGQSQDGFVYIPIQTFRKIYGTQDSLSVNVQSVSPHMMENAKDEARVLMRARRHLNPKEDDTFGFLEPSSLMDLWNNLTGTLASASVGIVSIFLVIGGIVIMNIMLASVTERTREIGVRKSLGATRRDILFQFIIESSVMS